MSMLPNTSFFILHLSSGEKAFLIFLLPVFHTGYYVVLWCYAVLVVQIAFLRYFFCHEAQAILNINSVIGLQM